MADRVGAFVTRATAGPLPAPAAGADMFFVALLAQRGPANVPTFVTGMSQFEAIFGGATPFADGARASAGYEVLKDFFESGGRAATVLRIVGANAAEASVTLVDRADPAVDTLTVTAKGPGAWFEGHKIVIAAGTRAGTFKLSVLSPADALLEAFDNLTLTDASLASVNLASVYVTLTNEASATAAPNNLPAIGTTTIDSGDGGVDDNAPAAAAIVGTVTGSVKTGLKAFTRRQYGRGIVVAPDLDSDASVVAELKAQTEAYFRLYFTCAPAGSTVASAIAAKPDGFNIGYYYPRRVVANTYQAGRLDRISPVGAIAALYAREVERKGPGKAPAGGAFEMRGAMETTAGGQPLIDEATAELLLASNVNPIWDRDGSGARVWGGRAASSDDAWRYLHAAYLWCLIADQFQRQLDATTYEISDGLYFTQVRQSLVSQLVDLLNQRAFRGGLPPESDPADPRIHAFDVQCNEAMLSPADREQGVVRVRAWFRPVGTAETILIELAKQNEG